MRNLAISSKPDDFAGVEPFSDDDDDDGRRVFLFLLSNYCSGFGLLESGCVSRKNELNIMVKNAVDVVLGGLSYW